MEDSNSLYLKPGPPVPGQDPEGPAETKGYRLNHTMIQIADPEVMVPFYRDVLGFRRVMTLNNGPCLQVQPNHRVHDFYADTVNGSVYYMAYYKTETTGKEVFEHMQQRDGLLELVHIKGVDRRLTNNMGHLGITVPDIKAAERRFRELKVDILKGLGEATSTKAAMCIPEEHWEAGPDLTVGFKKVFANMMMIRDPEGNFIEIVPHHAG